MAKWVYASKCANGDFGIAASRDPAGEQPAGCVFCGRGPGTVLGPVAGTVRPGRGPAVGLWFHDEPCASGGGSVARGLVAARGWPDSLLVRAVRQPASWPQRPSLAGAVFLVRALMLEAATRHGKGLFRLSLAGAVTAVRQWAPSFIGLRSRAKRRAHLDAFFRALATDTVPHRPDRAEPRAGKRRPKKLPTPQQTPSPLRGNTTSKQVRKELILVPFVTVPYFHSVAVPRLLVLVIPACSSIANCSLRRHVSRVSDSQ